MKKLLFIAFICTPFFTKAQVGVTVGPEVGASFGTFTVAEPSSNEIDEVYAGLSYHAGAAAHFQFGDWFAIRSAIYYKKSILNDIDIDEHELQFSDIEIPINILFSRNTQKNHKIFFGAGPNIIYTLNGKAQDDIESQEMIFGSEENEIKKMGLGLNAKIGMQLSSGFGFNFYFNAGLGDRSNYDEGYRLRNADLAGLNLSYLFGGNANNGGFARGFSKGF